MTWIVFFFAEGVLSILGLVSSIALDVRSAAVIFLLAFVGCIFGIIVTVKSS
jgi:hypothetical protein